MATETALPSRSLILTLVLTLDNSSSLKRKRPEIASAPEKPLMTRVLAPRGVFTSRSRCSCRTAVDMVYALKAIPGFHPGLTSGCRLRGFLTTHTQTFLRGRWLLALHSYPVRQPCGRESRGRFPAARYWLICCRCCARRFRPRCSGGRFLKSNRRRALAGWRG